jgi:hypothetical protein
MDDVISGLRQKLQSLKKAQNMQTTEEPKIMVEPNSGQFKSVLRKFSSIEVEVNPSSSSSSSEKEKIKQKLPKVGENQIKRVDGMEEFNITFDEQKKPVVQTLESSSTSNKNGLLFLKEQKQKSQTPSANCNIKNTDEIAERIRNKLT